MNCKPGDLAIVLSAFPWTEPHQGKVVRILQQGPEFGYGPTWDTDPALMIVGGDGYLYVEDSALRPIRDNDGEDETLTWAGKPAQHKETA